MKQIAKKLTIPLLATLAAVSITPAKGSEVGTFSQSEPDFTAVSQVQEISDGAPIEGYVEVNGANIFYQIQGEGEPMVLIHGYPLSGELFARNRNALAERYQVITLDLRGYGMSEAPDVPASVEIYAEDVLDVMSELDISDAIIGGMSMGGPIVFEMYRQAPDRFNGMILIDTIAAPASYYEAGLWRGVAQQAAVEGVESLIPLLMKDMMSGDTRVNQPELVNFLSNIISQASLEAAIGGAYALATRPDATPLLDSIEVPTLILVGLADTIYPVDVAQSMHEAIPTSTLVVIPGPAHASNFEAPDATNAAILEWASGIE